MTRLELSSLDTFFFREPAPFNAGEGGQVGQKGLFPPFMSTIQGMLRYQLALGQGWLPGHDVLWPLKLGDEEDLGCLRLLGPYLCKDGELLFPAPLYLLRREATDRSGRKQVTGYGRLVPGPEVLTDLGRVRLPVKPANLHEFRPMSGCWLSLTAMERVLQGGVPAVAGEGQVFASEDLWQYEARVGIKRDPATRTASDRYLYAVHMVRPYRGVSLVVGMEGIPSEWVRKLPAVVMLGGEGRLARMRISEEEIPLPAAPELKPVNGEVNFTITLITPCCFGGGSEAVKGRFPTMIPGQLQTACIDRVRQNGGWDLKNERPRPLRPFFPAGSTWFFKGREEDLDSIIKLHGRFIGDEPNSRYGYGQILIGRWEEER